MSKQKELKYEFFHDWLVGYNVNVGMKSGTVLQGEVRHIDKDIVVLVTEPKSVLDLETKIIHTILYNERIDFIQFKTDKKKD